MIRTSDGAMQRQFGVLFDAGSLGGWGDGALLDRFLAGRDDAAEAAFASLVERHGPMVLRVCRATLGDEHDAHDAFQATFLILARKARSVRIRDTVGPWLHGVAWRVASRARAASYRRRRHERRAAEMAPRSFEEARRDDAEATLHEEVRRLPAGFREAVVLCDLEGLTTDQAAERLGTPVGTVRSRLYRGRDRLRGRLLRRGLAPAAVGMVVASGTASAVMVPAALAEATVGLAVGWCWAGTVPIRLAWLVNGGRYAMGMKSVAAAGLSLCMVAGVGGYAAQRPGTMPGAPPGDGPPVAVAAREESKRGESDLDRLQGRWMVVKDEIVGGTVGGTTPGAPTPQAITFRGEGIMITRRETEEIVPFTIDASGRPKTIRLSSPPASQPEILAYELDGGRLRLTFDAADSRRVPSGLDAPTPERSLRRYDLIRDPVSPTAVGRVPATPLPDFRADRDRLQGRWAIVSARENGREADDPSILLSTITFRGDELRIAIRGHGDAGYSFRIDPDSSPRAMLLAPPDPKQDRPQWCLYAFEGHKLRLAFDMTMKRPGRPESFDEKDAEHPISVMELVRDEPPTPGRASQASTTSSPSARGPDVPPAAESKPVASDREQLQGTWSVIKATLNGREFDGPGILFAPMTFNGDVVEFGPFGSPPVKNSYRFLIDPEGEPRALRVVREGGKPRWWLYSLKGDKLRTAAWQSLDDTRRPVSFEDREDNSPLIVLELVRNVAPPATDGPKVSGPELPSPTAPVEELKVPGPELPAPTAPIDPVAPASATAPALDVIAPTEPAPPATPAPAAAPTAEVIAPTGPPDAALPPAPAIEASPFDEPPPRAPSPSVSRTPPYSEPRPSSPRPQPVQPAETSDFRRLQGTWSILALELDSADHEPDPDSAVLFAGNALVFVWGAKARGETPMTIESGLFTIDVQKRPGWIDVAPAQGGPPRQGIYRIEGPLLLFCLAEQGRPRPTAFDTAPDSGQFLFVLRRKLSRDARAGVGADRIGRDIHIRLGSPGQPMGPPMMPGVMGPGLRPGSPLGPTPAPSPGTQPLPAPRAVPVPSATPAPTPAAGPGVSE